MFIYMQMDVEYDKTTPAIEFSLLYDDLDMLTENHIKHTQKNYEITHRGI